MQQILRQYLVVTGTYWAFTITDGALRMLVVLFFYGLGYSALEIAMLFLFYEFFGVVTNLLGGWFGAKIGLNKTMHIGVLLQIISLLMLTVDDSMLTVAYVMFAQAISGIAKDLNKMSAKSAIKFLLPKEQQHGNLYKWVAILTGSKNALKGFGFFLGGLLLSIYGFQSALMIMAISLLGIFILSVIYLQGDFGKSTGKVKIKHLFSKSPDINRLSAARLFLFGARDVWFVVALPIYFQVSLGWNHTQVGSFMAIWIIAYGIVQGVAPVITGIRRGNIPDGRSATRWAFLLTFIPLTIVFSLLSFSIEHSQWILISGLILFGAVFAINSAVHSFLILAYSKGEGVSLDVGFYYMANASGRLFGTILSGVLFQWQGLETCLIVSSLFLLFTTLLSLKLRVTVKK